VVRKSIARVLTVYRSNIRAALKSKVTDEAASKKGKVREEQGSTTRGAGGATRTASARSRAEARGEDGSTMGNSKQATQGQQQQQQQQPANVIWMLTSICSGMNGLLWARQGVVGAAITSTHAAQM
jgi:hypothetical protein